MATFIVSFIFFATSAVILMLVQRLRGAPLPVGCTPENCCQVAGNDTACSKVVDKRLPPAESEHELAREA
jgi:hypothetical protein